jgi:TolB-like protein/DNA-binding winged helix-turn-helix (wHTH) protein
MPCLEGRSFATLATPPSFGTGIRVSGSHLLFDSFVIDTEAFELRRGGALVPVEPQVLELLVFLVRNRERMVSKDELIENVWGGRIVSDAALSSRIKSARQAIGDDGGRQHLIRTVHGRGFRFVGTVREGAADAQPLQAAPLSGAPPIFAASGPPSAPGPAAMPLPAMQEPPGGVVEAAVAQMMERPAIAVLPFVNLDDGHGHVADGLTDDIIAALSAWRWFPVLSRNAVYHRNDPAVPPAERGRQLGARYVLSGTVQLAGTRMKVRASLTDAESGLVLRADSLVREMDELFTLEDELAREIVGALEPELQTAERQRVMRKPPESLTAWDFAMQASWHMHRNTAQDFRLAEQLAKRAAERDPSWSHPYTLIAFVKFQQAMHSGSAIYLGEGLGEAKSAARAALDIDSRAWIAHALFGVAELWTSKNHGRALSHLRTALDLNPSANWTHHFHGCVAGYAGHLGDAQASSARTFRVDPHYAYTAIVKADLALWAMLDGQLDDAERLIGESLAWDPKYGRGIQRLAAIHGLKGNRDKAGEAVRRLGELGHPSSSDYFLTSYPFLREDHRETFLTGLRNAGIDV